MISELRRQVDGKEGKFVKVTGRSKNINSHDRTKKSKSKSEENSDHDRPFSSQRNNTAEISKMKSTAKSRNSKVSQNSQQRSASEMKSRSRSAEPHGQSQWMLRRPDRHHHPRDSWDSESDLSDHSWTLEAEPHSRSPRSRDSRSRSRSQVRELRGGQGSHGQGHRYSQAGVTRDRQR